MTEEPAVVDQFATMVRPFLLKNGQPYGCPSVYADRHVDQNHFAGVLSVLAKPAMKDAGTWEYHIWEDMCKEGLVQDTKEARWVFHQIAGWLSENDLVVIKLLQMGTAGMTGFFYKLADGVEVRW